MEGNLWRVGLLAPPSLGDILTGRRRQRRGEKKDEEDEIMVLKVSDRGGGV